MPTLLAASVFYYVTYDDLMGGRWRGVCRCFSPGEMFDPCAKGMGGEGIRRILLSLVGFSTRKCRCFWCGPGIITNEGTRGFFRRAPWLTQKCCARWSHRRKTPGIVDSGPSPRRRTCASHKRIASVFSAWRESLRTEALAGGDAWIAARQIFLARDL